MSRKYREYKAYLIALYRFYGVSPSYKMTLSWYKKFKREIQRNGKKMKKFRRKYGWKPEKE